MIDDEMGNKKPLVKSLRIGLTDVTVVGILYQR